MADAHAGAILHVKKDSILNGVTLVLQATGCRNNVCAGMFWTYLVDSDLARPAEEGKKAH